MTASLVLLLSWFLQSAGALFPEELGPLSVIPAEVTRRYAVFLGRPHRTWLRQEPLHIQSVLQVNRTLYIGARDDLFRVELDIVAGDEMFYSKKRTWESNKNDIKICRMKGKHADECRNFMKVLLSRRGGLFVCGTNAFNPLCANYTGDSLEMQGDPVSGMARCPYDPRHANVALFADRNLFTATVTDFLAIDAVIYRSLGENPALRSIKHDSKWFREPVFVSALEWGPHVYFFFREVAMEFNYLEKVVVSRVARVCKRDLGGSQRVLEKQWTSFLKARLNCSVPGDSHFYFDLLQSTSPVTRMQGRDVVLGVFSTPANSIPGSAVCVFDLEQLAAVFEGRFKEQKSPESIWTPVAEEVIPKLRPGGCAVEGSRFNSSNSFPDEVLNFVKTHPLMDEAVPSIGHRPWIVKTMVRYQLNRIVVDTEAGPFRNRTVLFLGSSRGTILKFLVMSQDNSFSSSIFLEELEGFNPDRCSDDSSQSRHLLTLTLDRATLSLLLVFPSCVVRVPLARCQLYSRCMRSCVSSRDPYCGWTRGSTCSFLRPGTRLPFKQDVEQENKLHFSDCDGVFLPESSVDEALVSLNLLVVSAVSAFATGAALAGLVVCCIMGRRRRARGRKSDREQSMLGHGGSVRSVTRGGGGRRDHPFVNGWSAALELLPTPEQTPLQQKRVVRLPDADWDDTRTFLAAAGSPCPGDAVVYLSSRFLQGDPAEVVLPPHTEHQRYLILAAQRGERRPDEYIYPVTPQDSPERRRVVSAPHVDHQPRRSHEALNYNSNNGVSFHARTSGGRPRPPPGQEPGRVRPLVAGEGRGFLETLELELVDP